MTVQYELARESQIDSVIPGGFGLAGGQARVETWPTETLESHVQDVDMKDVAGLRGRGARRGEVGPPRRPRTCEAKEPTFEGAKGCSIRDRLAWPVILT